MDAEERFINLETQLAFAQDEVTQLSQVLAQKDRRLMDLESRVERLDDAFGDGLRARANPLVDGFVE